MSEEEIEGLKKRVADLERGIKALHGRLVARRRELSTRALFLRNHNFKVEEAAVDEERKIWEEAQWEVEKLCDKHKVSYGDNGQGE